MYFNKFIKNGISYFPKFKKKKQTGSGFDDIDGFNISEASHWIDYTPDFETAWDTFKNQYSYYSSIAFDDLTQFTSDEDGNLYIIGGQNNPQGAFMITQEGSIYNLPQFPASLDHVVAIWFNNCLNVFFNTTWFTWHFGDTQWTNFGTLPVAINGCSIVVTDNLIHLVGGSDYAHYVYQNGEWLSSTSIPGFLYYGGSYVIDSAADDFIVFGGEGGNTIWYWHGATHTWTNEGNIPLVIRYPHIAKGKDGYYYLTRQGTNSLVKTSDFVTYTNIDSPTADYGFCCNKSTITDYGTYFTNEVAYISQNPLKIYGFDPLLVRSIKSEVIV